MTKKKLFKQSPHIAPAQFIIIGFLLLILLGGMLLMLPISSADGRSASASDAYFTAVSATCVTGLAVRDTMTEWSHFGHAVILTMIQIGGLGFMTFIVLISILLKRRITPRERMVIAESFNLNTYEGIVKLIRMILIGTLIVESIGAVLLATQFVPIMGVGEGIFAAIFHSVSAFCNAGFDLMGEQFGSYSSLGGFAESPFILLTHIALILIGGIGFVVWDDVSSLIRSRTRLSIYTRLVLIMTAILVIGGSVVFALLEWSNPETIGGMSPFNKIVNSLFYAVTLRTAGFTTFDSGALTSISVLISCLFMFIGGASGSTAGGIKMVTFLLIIYSVFRVAQGYREIYIFGRKISLHTVLHALTIAIIGMVCIASATVGITLLEGASLTEVIYECTSAFATVGISMGMTPSLSVIGRLVLMLLMFMGRVGILTITFSIMLNSVQKKSCIGYPEIQIMIG